MANEDRLFNDPRGPIKDLREEISPMTGIVTDPYNGISQQVADNHHQSETEKRDYDRQVYAQNPAKSVPEISPLKIDSPRRHDPFSMDNYGRTTKSQGESYVARLQNSQAQKGIVIQAYHGLIEFYEKHRKAIIAATFAGMVAAGIGYGAFVTDSQMRSFEEYKEISAEIPEEVLQSFETPEEREKYVLNYVAEHSNQEENTNHRTL